MFSTEPISNGFDSVPRIRQDFGTRARSINDEKKPELCCDRKSPVLSPGQVLKISADEVNCGMKTGTLVKGGTCGN